MNIMVISQISDAQTNLTILVFIGGLLGNIVLTIYGWWNAKGKYETEGIKITFDTKFIGSAIASFVPVVVLTAAGFNTLLDNVNASNPVSYGAAFITAFLGTLVTNYLANTQIKNVNIKEANELKEKQILNAVKLHEFNMSLKREQNKSLENAIFKSDEEKEEEEKHKGEITD